MAAVFPANQVIVVGGGLAGMSAANTVVENGGAKGLTTMSGYVWLCPIALAAKSIQVRIVCRVKEKMERCKDAKIAQFKVQTFQGANMFKRSNVQTNKETKNIKEP